MKTIRRAGLLALWGAALVALQAPHSARAASWNAAFVKYSGPVTFASGETATVSIDFRNTGTEAWAKTGAHAVRLGTANPHNRASLFAMDSWPSASRAATFAGRVGPGDVVDTLATTINPGETARFSFTMAAPPVNATTTFKEYFQPVAEGIQWLGLTGPYFPVTVAPRTYSYAHVAHTSPPILMQPGTTANLTLDLENTGTATWRRDAATSFRIGTSHPMDRLSALAGDEWISRSRLPEFAGKLDGGTVVDSDTIAPGETARFSFTFKASRAGSFKEYFQPLIERSRWLRDTGIYFQTHVPGADYDYAYQSHVGVTDRLQPGSQATVKLRLLNTGFQDWHSSGTNAVKLGTDHPRDGSSPFYTSGNWLATNRVHLTRNLTDPSQDSGGETTVSPGEVGEWEFILTAPNRSGTTKQYFTPVVSGLQWMKDTGLYFAVSSWRPIKVGLGTQPSGKSPSITSTGQTKVRNDSMVFASPSAGTPITLAYSSGTYAAKIGASTYTSATPIRVEQPTGAIATVGNLGDSSSNNKFRGFLYLTFSDGVWLINKVDIEDYTKGQGEVSDGWPTQAIKAQVVAFRTYGAYHMLHPTAAGVYDLTDRSQVYNGYLAESGKPNTAVAVDETRGKVMKYNGEVIQAYYAADTGGASESNENVWNATPLPYLRGKSDPYKANSSQIDVPSYQTVTDSRLRSTSNFNLPGPAIQSIQVIAKYPSGRWKTVRFRINGANYDRTYLADTMRAKFGPDISGERLRSDLIVGLSKNGSNWTIATKGFGHGIGMGQWGAYNQAASPNNRNYVQILQFYYTGVTIGSL